MENELYFNWDRDFSGTVTICDTKGIILYMNNKALDDLKDDGGSALLGTNVLDCHPEPSKTQLENMLKERSENTYSVEKAGKKKLIHQGPWYKDGMYAGIVEISFALPANMPNVVR